MRIMSDIDLTAKNPIIFDDGVFSKMNKAFKIGLNELSNRDSECR